MSKCIRLKMIKRLTHNFLVRKQERFFPITSNVYAGVASQYESSPPLQSHLNLPEGLLKSNKKF